MSHETRSNMIPVLQGATWMCSDRDKMSVQYQESLNQQASTRMKRQITMFYDGGCPLCRREVNHYRRLDSDNRVHWVDISVESDLLEPFHLNREAAMARLHVLDREGQMHTGAAAFARLWCDLPYYRWLGGVVRYLGLVPLLDRIYEPFARWRLARRRNNCPA